MDWKQQFKIHDLSFRDTCIILLLLAFISFILIQIDFGQVNPEAVSKAYRTMCASRQQAIYGIMRDLPDGEDFELPPGWTVADLIREAVGKDRRASSPIPGKEFFCRNVFYESAFLLFHRKRRAVAQPYLVFPMSASVVFDKSQQPVPILMCPPGAHGDKHGSMVLYSDGTVEKLTTEEAERLVAEQHPIQLELKITGVERESEPGDIESETALKRLGAE